MDENVMEISYGWKYEKFHQNWYENNTRRSSYITIYLQIVFQNHCPKWKISTNQQRCSNVSFLYIIIIIKICNKTQKTKPKEVI